VRKPHLDLLALAPRRSKSSVPTNDRATSRACSWISRGILRDGSLGSTGFGGHTSQSTCWRDTSVLPSCTVPLVPSCFPPGSGRRRRLDHIESRRVRRCRRPLRLVVHRNMGRDTPLPTSQFSIKPPITGIGRKSKRRCHIEYRSIDGIKMYDKSSRNLFRKGRILVGL
jgi:hypothetical protein